MKQIQPFQKHWLQITSIVVCRLNTLHGWRDEAIAILQITFWVFLNENYCILIKIWLNFVSKNLIDNKSAWVQIMAWCRTGDTPLSGPMIINSSFAWVD